MADALFRSIAPTPFVTVQDAGRRGWRRFGLAGAGAMDKMSLVIANALVGNRPTEAVLEFAYAGGEWTVEAASCRIAVAGGAFAVTVDGTPVPSLASTVLRRGQTLRIGGATRRVWGYLAVAGGFDLPLAFGSRATHARTGIGGFEGRAIRAGDTLPLRGNEAPNEPERFLGDDPEEDGPCRVVPGPQDDYFDRESLSLLLSGAYQATWQQDRMAYRLDGPRLTHVKGYNIITDGIVPGCIQIPGTGQPIVLMRDAGTVGGYPKVATVVEADLGRLAQTRPGGAVHFKAISMMEARAVRQRFLARLQLIAEEVNSPLPRAAV
jgi:biotin-dependent carboxylase-like uncharacterized protein